LQLVNEQKKWRLPVTCPVGNTVLRRILPTSLGEMVEALKEVKETVFSRVANLSISTEAGNWEPSPHLVSERKRALQTMTSQNTMKWR
jgi:hypothetical protein